LPCAGKDRACHVVRAAAASAANDNAPAIYDMTSDSRYVVNRAMAPVDVHVWAYAGEALGPKDMCTYYWRNDVAVGCKSAHGVDANLGTHVLPLCGPDWHMRVPPAGIPGYLDPNEFQDASLRITRSAARCSSSLTRWASCPRA
jgi:hypothetical protein